MKINDIIKKGEVLDAEQLAKVTGGAGVIVTNTDCPTNKNCPTNENCPTNAYTRQLTLQNLVPAKKICWSAKIHYQKCTYCVV